MNFPGGPSLTLKGNPFLVAAKTAAGVSPSLRSSLKLARSALPPVCRLGRFLRDSWFKGLDGFCGGLVKVAYSNAAIILILTAFMTGPLWAPILEHIITQANPW